MKLSQKFLHEFDGLVLHWLKQQRPVMQNWFKAEIERLLDGCENHLDWPAREEFYVISRFNYKKDSFDPKDLLILDILDSACIGADANDRFTQFESCSITILGWFLDTELVALFNQEFEKYTSSWGQSAAEKYRHCFRDSVKNLERKLLRFRQTNQLETKEALRGIVLRSISKIVRPNRVVNTKPVEPEQNSVLDTLILQEVAEGWATILFRCGQCALSRLGRIGKMQDANNMVQGFLHFFSRQELMYRAYLGGTTHNCFMYNESQRYHRLQVVSEILPIENCTEMTAFFLLIDPRRRLIWFDYLHSRFLHLWLGLGRQLHLIKPRAYFRSALKKANILLDRFPEDFAPSPPVSLPESLFQETLGRIRPRLMEKLELLIDWKIPYAG